MRKLICITVVLFLVGLTGCTDKDVKHTEYLIDTIGVVTLENSHIVKTAQTSYEALSDKQKSKVDNYAILQTAIITLDELEKQYDATNIVGTWTTNYLNETITYVFSEDGTCTYTFANSGKKGNATYSYDGVTLTMHEGGAVSTFSATKDGDILVMVIPSDNGTGTKLTCTRVSESKNEQDVASSDTTSVQQNEDEYDWDFTEESNENRENSTGATLGERNALEKSLQYLDYTAFSYSGLVEQLKYEGYSNAEAIYAVDHCGANWNEQAAKKAREYLEYSAFSRTELFEQLKYEGFTDAQAQYGVTSVGY